MEWGERSDKNTQIFDSFIFHMNHLFPTVHCTAPKADVLAPLIRSRTRGKKNNQQTKQVEQGKWVLLQTEIFTELWEILFELCCKTCVFAQVNSETVSKEKTFFNENLSQYLSAWTPTFSNYFSLSLICIILRNATLRSKKKFKSEFQAKFIIKALEIFKNSMKSYNPL